MSHASHQSHDRPHCPAQAAKTRWGYVAWAAVLAVGYFATAKLGLMLPTVGASVTLIWPPTGIAVFALFCWGRRYWPGVAAGAFAVNLTLGPAWVAAGIAFGNTLAPLAAAALLRWCGFDPAFRHRRDVLRFALLAAVVAMLVSAVNGSAWLLLAGVIDWAGFVRSACIWWAGDGAGVLVFGPVLFGCRGQLARWRRDGLPVGAVVWLAAVAVSSAVVFTPLTPVGRNGWPIGFVPMLLLAWANVGYRGWVASVGVAAVCVFAICGTAVGAGQFGQEPPDVQLFQVWVYLVTVALVSLTVTAVLGEREAAQQAQAGREAEYRALVDDNPALVVRFTRGGVVTFVNDTYCRFKAMTRDELCGRSIYDLIVGPSRDGVRRLFERYDAEGGPLTFLGPFFDRTGAERWIDWKGREVDGGQIQVVGLDVTDRQRAEQERRRSEERMVQAQKLESLGAIAGGAAHEFNNLLTGVLGHADLAAALVPPDDPIRSHLAVVMESAARAADLSRQMLAYTGKGRLVIRPVDLNAVVTRAVELGTKSFPNKVTVRKRLADSLPAVESDETQLQQVLLNLIRNAREAIGDEVGVVELDTGVEELTEPGMVDAGTGEPVRPGRYVRVTVGDGGCGIPADVRPRIFEPFFSTKFLGRGLGLAAVQGIVRAHGGAVLVASEPGRGTAVTVLFPAAAAPVPPPAVNQNTPIEVPSADRRKAVLVVDDEESVRGVTVQMIRQLGWEVFEAADGRDGVSRFRRHADQIRFVVLDLTMPVMDGWQALATMRRVRADLPILLCTGHNEDSIANPDPLTTGVLFKPFRVVDLQRAVNRLLNPNHSTPPVAAGGG